MKISIIDTETTGLTPKEGKLIEVAVVNFDTVIGDVIESGSFLVCDDKPPHEKLSEGINKTFDIHGIRLNLIIQYGANAVDAQKTFEIMTSGSEAILAHNAEFDMQWFDLSNNSFISDERWVCTQNDIKWPKESASKSLVSIALAHGVGVVSAHRALEDCLTIARLLRRTKEMNWDLDAMIMQGMRPKATFKALVSYDNRELARKAGFRWDSENKYWYKKMAVDDISKLGFPTVQINRDVQTTMFDGGSV